MNLTKIREMPTVYANIHESVFRSFHILEGVKYLLAEGTSPSVVLAIIKDLETDPKEAKPC